jgi:hypothetical protein
MSGNRPAYRITYKAKDGVKYDVGVIWNPKKPIDGLIGSLSPQKTNEDGQYKKMRLAEALERVERGEGYLDVWSTDRRSNDGTRPRRNESDGGSDPFGSDQDIPFAPRGDVL